MSLFRFYRYTMIKHPLYSLAPLPFMGMHPANSPLVFGILLKLHKFMRKQECIPVGCVPPAAVAVEGVSTRYPPGSRHALGPDIPQNQAPPLGPGTPPRTRHPPGPDTPRDQAPPGTRPPWTRHPPGAGSPLWTESQTPVKNYLPATS